MVIRLTEERSVASNSSGRRSTAKSRFVGNATRELSRKSRLTSFQDLDSAIAQIAGGLRILLNLGLDSERDNLNLRSEDVSTETSSANTSDRYDVLVVENYEDGAGAEKANWTRVGVAFPHKDGNGLNVELRAIPVSGKLVIRRHEAKSKSTAS
jgi:hypothetical protein